MEVGSPPPGVVAGAGVARGLPKLALPSGPPRVDIPDAPTAWEVTEPVTTGIQLPPPSPIVVEDGSPGKRHRRRRRKKRARKVHPESPEKAVSFILPTLPTTPGGTEVKRKPRSVTPKTKRYAVREKPPLMPEGTLVSYYRPPIGYAYGPVYPMHDHTSLRLAKLRASRMVQQVNATMNNITKFIQAWYRGERVRKRLRFLKWHVNIVQRFWRGYTIRRDIAFLHKTVVPIQALVRGVLVRKILRYWRWSTILVQARIRGMLMRTATRKYLAARTMQAGVRCFLAKLSYKRFRYAAKKATRKLQNWWRAGLAGYRARVMVARLRAMIKVVVVLQGLARKWLARRHAAAALCIQRNLRAYFVRRLIAEYYIQILETDTMRMEEEVQLMAEAEADAVEDMADYLVSNWKGRLDTTERAKALRAEARARKKLFTAAAAGAGADGLDPTLRLDHPVFDFVRHVFKMYDVDDSGTLDEDELGLMLKQLAVPAGQEEFEKAIEWVDKDGNGVLDPNEFIILYMYLETGAFPAGHTPPPEWFDGVETTWHNAAGDALGEEEDGGVMAVKFGAAEQAKRALTKAAMHGSNFVKLHVTGTSTHHVLARKVLTREAKISAANQARIQFRYNSPPRISCPACSQTFPFWAMLESHVGWAARTCPVKETRIRPMHIRYGLRKPKREWKPVVEKELMPERFRLFAEHRTKVERTYKGRGRQGRVADPRPKLAFFNKGNTGAGESEEDELDEDDLATTEEEDEDGDEEDYY